MGRLFWKFFLFFGMASLATALALGMTAWLLHLVQKNYRSSIDSSPPAALVVNLATSILRQEGEPALRRLLVEWMDKPIPRLLVIDETGQDMLKRPVPENVAKAVSGLANGSEETIDAVRHVRTQEGRSWRLFVLAPPMIKHHRHHGGPPPPPFPLLPPLMGIVGGLIFAALLAWYFSRPIRGLRDAFVAVAEGDLNIRIGNRMGTRRDELTDLARDFDRMVGRLQILVENQQRLLHDVSHELRSPLARLQAAIDLIRQQPERASEFMARVEQESIRMDHLVGELLTLARLDARGVGQHFDEIVDLGEVLANIAEDAQFEAAPKNCTVVLECPESIQFVGNAELLHRAFENVTRNAVRYSPDAANIFIGVVIDPAVRCVEVTIEDEGQGVPESDLERIFEPFVRVDGTNRQGYGLGLAIARRIIRAHDGEITASGSPRGGVKITIRFTHVLTARFLE